MAVRPTNSDMNKISVCFYYYYYFTLICFNVNTELLYRSASHPIDTTHHMKDYFYISICNKCLAATAYTITYIDMDL